MKKLNGGLSLILIAICLFHFIHAALMFTGILPHSELIVSVGRGIFTLMFLHGVYGMVCYCKGTCMRKKQQMNFYPKQNKSYYIQAWSGIAASAFMALHMLTIKKFCFTPSAFGLFNLAVFTIFMCVHMIISFPKAMITVGVSLSGKSQKIYGAVGFMIISLAGIACIAAATYYVAIGGLA